MTNFILDTDFIINFFVKTEPNHLKAVNILEKYPNSSFILSNLIKYEFCTVLSRKFEQSYAVSLLELVPWQEMSYVFIDEEIEEKTLYLYKSFNKKNISFVDCSNLVLAKEYSTKIASFDKFYPSDLLIN